MATDSILYSIMSWRLPEFCTMRATMGRKGRSSMWSMYTRWPAISQGQMELSCLVRICVIKTLKKCNQRETKETNLELDTSAGKAWRVFSVSSRIWITGWRLVEAKRFYPASYYASSHSAGLSDLLP